LLVAYIVVLVMHGHTNIRATLLDLKYFTRRWTFNEVQSVLLQFDNCLLVRPHVISNRVTKIKLDHNKCGPPS